MVRRFAPVFSLAAEVIVSSTSSESPCLIVVLTPELKLLTKSPWPFEQFNLGDVTFIDAGFGEWSAFYDWLRDSHGRVIGVRYWALDESAGLLEATQRLSYVRTEPPRCLEIYFAGCAQDVDHEHSSDQAFLYDPVFRAPDGSYAIAFETSDLAPGQLQRLVGSVSG